MKKLFASGAILTLLIGSLSSVLAQQPSLAPDNLEFTESVIEKNHLVVRVELESQKNQFTRYQYDHYPEVERIKTENGVFARVKNKPWLRSDDWGATGTPVTDDVVQQLNWFISIIGATFEEPNLTDTTQGGIAWKFISKSNNKTFTYYTYERSREYPKSNGIYPRYTFMKSSKDTDGKLLLCQTTAQLRSDGNLIPVIIRFDYLFEAPQNIGNPQR